MIERIFLDSCFQGFFVKEVGVGGLFIRKAGLFTVLVRDDVPLRLVGDENIWGWFLAIYNAGLGLNRIERIHHDKIRISLLTAYMYMYIHIRK